MYSIYIVIEQSAAEVTSFEGNGLDRWVWRYVGTKRWVESRAYKQGTAEVKYTVARDKSRLWTICFVRALDSSRVDFERNS